jgi:acyl-CoA synthetase (AMP-forming)/AMP-acid ligase II
MERSLDATDLTVPALLARQAAARGDRPLLICDDDVLTYADASARSAALAQGLLAAGAGKGTHIGMLHPNGSAVVVAWLAAARIGAVSIPLSTFSTSGELHTLLQNADIELLLASRSYRGRDFVAALHEVVPGAASFELHDSSPILSEEVPSLRRVVFDTQPLLEAGAAVPYAVLAAAEAAVRPADRMVIVHTSGSTSAPKGVIHQHGPLIRHLGNLNELRALAPDDVLFSNSPFFWIGGFAYSLLGTLVAGSTLVCSNATDPAATLDLLEETRPTMVNGFAAAVAHLAKDPSFEGRDLTSIRRGNLWPIMPAALRPADPELRHNMLGMTEAGSVCLASDDLTDQPEHRRGSFGRPVPGIEAKVVDAETGAVAAVGEPGELWLRGPSLMEGYYGRERHETFTPDGWYRTGDLFRVDGDGFHYFIGRQNDMIKTAGANVAPLEVEAAIADATGLVAHVVGIDDPARGQLVAAAIRVPKGHDHPDEDELHTALRERLSAYKVPKRYRFLADDEVPMLSSGKLDGRALRELLSGG